MISIHALLAESDRSAGPLQAECTDFYPRSPCGERHLGQNPAAPTNTISIHALLAESDHIRSTSHDRPDISIHALLAESDRPGTLTLGRCQKFLSTLSLRRATWEYTLYGRVRADFYPRSPCGERPRDCPASSPRPYFYPRSPCGERRHGLSANHLVRFISIHALLAESDKTCALFVST